MLDLVKSPYRVLLCDDHDRLRSRCREMLAQAPDLDVVGEADGGYSGIEMALALAPDLVVMDVDMPDLDGIEATRQILAQQPDIKVLAYSAGSDWPVVQQMLFAGALGYLVKDADTDSLLRAVRVLLDGGRFLSDKIKVPVAPPTKLAPAFDGIGDAGQPSPQAVQVVLVDDSAIVRERLAGLLAAQEGIVIAGQASDIASGLALLRQHQVDVLVSDLDLARESGIELVQAAKQEHPALLAIILTDHDHPKLRKWCADLGADFYFHKPTEFEKVIDVCQNLFQTRELTTWLAALRNMPNETENKSQS
jgi:DNA-binding NarL/FixJ family response regulator